MSCTLSDFSSTAAANSDSSDCVVGVAGGRDFSDRFGLFIDDEAVVVERAIDELAPFDVEDVGAVRHGDCRGVDQWGEAFAQAHDLPVARFPAHFDILGGRAGPLRNSVIAMACDYLVAVMDETDAHPGTRSMRNAAARWDCEVVLVDVSKDSVREAIFDSTL